MAPVTTQVVLGEGVLNWPRGERVGDRYGLLVLLEDTYDSEFGPVPGSEKATTDFAGAPFGEQGKLVAEVVAGRESSHIGDLFRSIFQRKVPKRGERFVLGSGELFTETAWEGVEGIGVLPHDRRETDWLDPARLYDLHDSVVRLLFEMEV